MKNRIPTADRTSEEERDETVDLTVSDLTTILRNLDQTRRLLHSLTQGIE